MIREVPWLHEVVNPSTNASYYRAMNESYQIMQNENAVTMHLLTKSLN